MMRAEELEALIAKDPNFPVNAEQLVRFRLGGVGSFFASDSDLNADRRIIEISQRR